MLKSFAAQSVFGQWSHEQEIGSVITSRGAGYTFTVRARSDQDACGSIDISVTYPSPNGTETKSGGDVITVNVPGGANDYCGGVTCKVKSGNITLPLGTISFMVTGLGN
jgi:hypothetical protein